MKEHIQRVMHSSKKSDWRTPPELFEKLSAEFDFTVDVAANTENHLSRFHPSDHLWFGPGGQEPDGLTADWQERSCFMNPPYSRGNKKLGIPSEPIEPWLKKAWVESQDGATVVGVLPFNPQTQWFRWYVMGEERGNSHFFAAMEVRWLTHRVTFNRPDGTPADNAPGNTCIVVWRPNPGYVGPWTPAVRYWSYR